MPKMPSFNLSDYELQRDPDESDADYAARHALFKPIDRVHEKRESRERDAARLAAGEKIDNGFFSVLDRSKAKLVVRRAKIRIPPESA